LANNTCDTGIPDRPTNRSTCLHQRLVKLFVVLRPNYFDA